MGEVKDMFELGMHPLNCLLTAFRGLIRKAFNRGNLLLKKYINREKHYLEKFLGGELL